MGSGVKIKSYVMAKPVFVVRYPKYLPQEEIAILRKNMDDYHILAVPSNKEEFSFECHNVTDADSISFELLQMRVNEITAIK